LDKWEIGPGDDIVGKINAGLEEATAGIIVFSRIRASRVVEYLTYADPEGKVLIPAVLAMTLVPPLLHRSRVGDRLGQYHDAAASPPPPPPR
jgi:hypothetical protein